jgi:predicted lactoylglutathione lyase
MRMIFVNLPVRDLPASERFFGELDGHVWELIHMQQQ